MAKKEIEEKKVNEGVHGIGQFKEATGGGEPIPKGQKMTTQRRVMQPRDENGQFTYNAANKHPLKDGPSRGKTIPPYLNLKKEEEQPKNHEYIQQMDKYDFEEGKSKEVRTNEKGKENVYNVETKYDDYNRQSFATDLQEYTGKELYTSYWVGNILHYKLKENETIDPTSKEGFDYQTKIGETSYETKKGKKSLEENAALAGDYKGDINQMEFAGNKIQKEEVVDKISSYKASGKKSPEILKYFKAKPKQEVKHQQPQKQPAALQPAPQQPKPAAPKHTGPFGDEDKKLASEGGGMGFVSKYANEIDEITKLADEAGWDLGVQDLVQAIASGELGSFDEAKEVIKHIND